MRKIRSLAAENLIKMTQEKRETQKSYFSLNSASDNETRPNSIMHGINHFALLDSFGGPGFCCQIQNAVPRVLHYVHRQSR